MEVYIPANWLDMGVESLKLKLFAIKWDIENEAISEFDKEQRILQALWLEERIPIVQTENLLKGEPI